MAESPDGEHLFAGTFPVHLYRSDDVGETWTDRAEGVNDDIHGLHLRGPDEYVASTGYGLYRTTDAGASWNRIDPAADTGLGLGETGGAPDHLGVGGDTRPRRYVREATSLDGRLYTAAATGPTGTWVGERGGDAALYGSDDDGRVWEAVEYPGAPVEFRPSRSRATRTRGACWRARTGGGCSHGSRTGGPR